MQLIPTFILYTPSWKISEGMSSFPMMLGADLKQNDKYTPKWFMPTQTNSSTHEMAGGVLFATALLSVSCKNTLQKTVFTVTKSAA